MRQHRMRGLGFTYELGTTALVGGVQVPWIPCEEYIDRVLYLQMPALPRLSALGRPLGSGKQTSRRQHVEIARMLENQLSCSDRFRYSLEGQDRDPAIDAIEDFVSNHPLGHCEYFATALALMLRSQGIPSRWSWVTSAMNGTRWAGTTRCGSRRRTPGSRPISNRASCPPNSATTSTGNKAAGCGWTPRRPMPWPRRARPGIAIRSGCNRCGPTTCWRWIANGSGRRYSNPCSTR